ACSVRAAAERSRTARTLRCVPQEQSRGAEALFGTYREPRAIAAVFDCMAGLSKRWRASARAGGGTGAFARMALGLAVGVLGLCVGEWRACADEDSSLRYEGIPAWAHGVEVTLYGDYAERRVRRTVHNTGRRHDQAKFFIEVPGGAVATRLRTMGKQGGR